MNKKVIAIILMMVCLLMTACGNSEVAKSEESAATEVAANVTETSTETENTADEQPVLSEPEVPKEPVSLIGTWADEGNDLQVAAVDEDTITVYWVMEDGGYQLYWSGNYEIPDTYSEEFSWESINFHDITDYALLASTSDTKEFRYEDGAICYEGSMQGTTFTIRLTPARVVGIETKKPGSAANALAEKLELELVDSGYSVTRSTNYIHVPYTVVIHNPNEGFAVEYPTIIVTARDESGAILNNEEQTLSYVAAGDTITYSNYAFWEGSVLPGNVEISVKTGKNDYSVQNDEFLYSSSFELKNISIKKDSWSLKVTGELTNLSEVDLYSAAISANFIKDGKYIGGDTNYADEIAAGETIVFDFSVDDDIEDYDDIILTAMEW